MDQEALKSLAIGTGILLGAVVIVWTMVIRSRRQSDTWSDAGLLLLGAVLVGFAIFSSIKVSVSDGGLEVEFQRLRQDVAMIANLSDSLAGQVEAAATASDRLRENVRTLATAVERPGQVDVMRVRSVLREVHAAPAPDQAKLARIRGELQRVSTRLGAR